MAEYWFPQGFERAPLAIILHGIGGRNPGHCRRIARSLIKMGIASIIPFMIFHVKRMPLSIRDKYPKLTSEEWFECYQCSVIDVHQIIDWAQTRSELDSSQTSIVGYSYGSFISSISMAVDKRIKAGIFIEAGGNSSKITRHSPLLRWSYKLNGQEYRRDQELYLQYVDEVAIKGFENLKAPKASYLTDPLTFSSYLKGRPLLMIGALFDEMIPRVSTLDFWDANGKPPLYWYPATHASLWLWYPLMARRMTEFLIDCLIWGDGK